MSILIGGIDKSLSRSIQAKPGWTRARLLVRSRWRVRDPSLREIMVWIGVAAHLAATPTSGLGMIERITGAISKVLCLILLGVTIRVLTSYSSKEFKDAFQPLKTAHAYALNSSKADG